MRIHDRNGAPVERITDNINDIDACDPVCIMANPNGVQVLFGPETEDEANCYAIVDTVTRQAAVIDPGRHHGPRMHAHLAERRMALAYILITHAHQDHVEGLRYMLEHTNATVAAHPSELIRVPTSCRPARYGGECAHHDRFLPLADGQTVQCGSVHIKALTIPGHTEGSLAFHVLDEKIVCTGDTLFRGGIGRTKTPADKAMLIAGIKDRIMTLDVGTRILPGHGAFTTVGQERATNRYMNE